MPTKSFLEKFNKFAPDANQYKILSNISDYTLRVSKENRIIEAVIFMDELVAKKDLYKIERDIEKAYELNHVKLLAKYPSELFSYDYIPQILIETEVIGIVARGFFSNYTYDLTDSELIIHLPFTQNGVMLLEDANTPRVIEKIISSEFGINIKVTIKHTREETDGYSEYMRRELEALDKHLQKASEDYEKYQSQRPEQGGYGDTEPTEVESKPALPRIQTVFNEDATPIIEDGICKIGHLVYKHIILEI